jgi:serine/threonine protein kinase
MDVITKFGNVIGETNGSNLTQIVRGLSGERGLINTVGPRVTTRYLDRVINLPIITFVLDPGGDRGTITIGGISETVVRIGGGTYGTIFLGNKSQSVYKRMIMPPTTVDAQGIEEYHREVFIEAYIQTVLQCDPIFGKNIAHIENLYRDVGVTRFRSNYTYYYKMESIPYTLDRHLQRPGRTKDDNLRLISDLASVLEHFNLTCGFRHRDLHAANVMFGEDGTLKLIDFGQACINQGGTVYSVNDTVCSSYDIFIFLTFVLEYAIMNNISGEINALLSDKELNIYDELAKPDPYIPNAFWKVYHYRIRDRTIYPWSDATIHDRFIRNIGEAKLRPDKLVNAWRQITEHHARNNNNNNIDKQCSLNPLTWFCRRRKTKTAGGRLRRLGKSKSKKLRKR